MPTVGTTPSLEATQAVGAVLLHQFARERFLEAGIDENLIRQAEDQTPLNELVETLLHDEDPRNTGTCNASNLDVANETSNESSQLNDSSLSTPHNNTLESTVTNAINQNECGANSNGSQNLNGSSIQHTTTDQDNFQSMMSESVGPNGTTMMLDRTLYHSMNASHQQGVANSPIDRLQATEPSLASYGKELRRIAEEFEKSRLRQTVKDRACQVNLHDITKESFVKLLEELFQEKITREKIVILFFFCTDVALRAAMFAQDLVIKLMGWSFSYIINTVCSFIHRIGGWDKVLFYQLPSILITCCAALAICSLAVYLRKNLLKP